MGSCTFQGNHLHGKAHGRAIWSPTSTPPIATARRARYSPGGRSRPAFPEPAGTSNPRSWQLAGRPPKHQFSRDIAPANGYLMASRRARLYTAPDRADTAAFRANLAARTGVPTTNSESDKARSMSGFKEPSFADRQKAAQQAKQDILNKFRSQPGLDDPAVAQRRAERESQAAERAKAKLARDAAKAEQKVREAAAAAEAAAQLVREKEEAIAREAALEAEKKAARDARYAARKKRK